MSFPPSFFHGPAVMIPARYPDGYVESLQRWKAAITRLTTALHEYLCLDIDAQLKQATEPRPQMPPPSIEDLESAQRQREQVQDQIEALENMIGNGNLPEVSAEYLRKFQLDPLRTQLQMAEDWITRIQTAIESAAQEQEPGPTPSIQTLGEQIIIRTIPVDQVGSIILPDSAKSITMMPDGKPMEAVHFVEAEVIATGPGKRGKGDARLLEDMAEALRRTKYSTFDDSAGIHALLIRAQNRNSRIPMLVKPGDKILYHPAVQKFDRDITDFMSTGEEAPGSKYFIIREGSVLAILELGDQGKAE